MYYCAFALIYGLAGSCSDVIMVNSTWTLGHIPALWRIPSRTGMVYLPCDVRFFIDMPLEDEVKREIIRDRKCHSIVSVGVVECMAAGTPGSQVRLPQAGHRGSLRGWTDWLPGRQRGQLRHCHGDHPDPVVGGTMKIRRNSRRSVHRFSNHEFDSSFLSSMEPLMGTQQRRRKTNHSHLRLKPLPSAALTGLIGRECCIADGLSALCWLY
ncbi:GDP-Man:Man(3)GlcNAc(2)-PP-Dol alpha-1,2-mannosyltransferase-like [Salvelinus alpinus]|uniref:GDP-Man:Man(3)GlcNAc(2)-PP-Dol alpha-1,2-mannosyltransferase-like n=1 Tax=Salvelinus alpinus TaxID=8036 RepID=UPI0039FC153A